LFLDTAEIIIAQSGYEATTMTAIAEQSGASIGALYRYFPDKPAVAQALYTRYANEIEGYFQPLIATAESMPPKRFASQLIDLMVRFLEERPAYWPLSSAPIKFSRSASSRLNFRYQFCRLFMAKSPWLSEKRALLITNVALQLVKGLKTLYLDCPIKERPSVVTEFKKILADYLNDAL
jgi:AcrR family transcriptional regulator